MENLLGGEKVAGESLLSKVEILSEREGGLVEAMVPIELIDHMEVPVDQGHVDDLIDSMNVHSQTGKISGQLTPVLVGEVAGKSKFSLIDGFHRDAAIYQSDKAVIFATIRRNTTEEEIEDLRILTANSHKSVSFARIYEWVGSTWDKSPWAQKVTAAQAFSLANNKKMTGRYIGLDQHEAEAVREWALDKCTKWHMSAGAIQKIMTTAAIADPELVKSARTRKSGHELIALTPDHLKVIAMAYPYVFDIQNGIAEVTKAQNLTIAETAKVVEFLKPTTQHDETLAKIEETNWQDFFGKIPGAPRTYTTKAKKAETPIPEEPKVIRPESRGLPTKYMHAQIEIAKLATENVVLRGQYVAAPLHDSRQPEFTINYNANKKLEEMLTPSSRLGSVDDLLARLDVLKPKLIEVLMGRQVKQSDAEHIVRSIGQRLSQDIEKGGLKFVVFSRPQMFDELIKTCLRDELETLKRGKIATVTPIDHGHEQYALDATLELLPQLPQESRSILTLGGLLHMGTHSIAQVINLSNLQTQQLTTSLKHRLSASERIFTGEANPAKNQVV